MGQSSPKSGKVFPKTGESFPSNRGQLSPACADRAMDFLRRQHPAKTAEEIEAATCGRVSAATAKKWLSRTSAPSFLACFALISAYGPGFLAAVMDERPAWLNAAARAERLATLEEESRRIEAERARLSHLLDQGGA